MLHLKYKERKSYKIIRSFLINDKEYWFRFNLNLLDWIVRPAIQMYSFLVLSIFVQLMVLAKFLAIASLRLDKSNPSGFWLRREKLYTPTVLSDRVRRVWHKYQSTTSNFGSRRNEAVKINCFCLVRSH